MCDVIDSSIAILPQEGEDCPEADDIISFVSNPIVLVVILFAYGVLRL